jgi:hypothetical protein
MSILDDNFRGSKNEFTFGYVLVVLGNLKDLPIGGLFIERAVIPMDLLSVARKINFLHYNNVIRELDRIGSQRLRKASKS